MAREIVVTYQGEPSHLPLQRVERSKLYGRKRRLVVDADGNPCSMALLTVDGSALLPPGTVASLYVDENFDTVERGELVAVDADGNDLPLLESSLGQERALQGPVSDDRVLDLTVTAVYQLDEEGLTAELQEALSRGEIFETRFNYTRGYRDAPLLLLKNDEGLFGLVGEETAFEYASHELPDTDGAEDEDDPFDGELDFSF